MANKKKPAAKQKKPLPKKAAQNKAAPKKTAPKKTAPKKRAPADPKEILRRMAIAVLAVLLVAGAILTSVSVRGELLQKKVTLRYAGVQQVDGVLPIEANSDSIRERVRATKRHGLTGKFSFFCNDRLELGSPIGSCSILFGNPADNDCDLVLFIVDDNGDQIYRTDGLEPGKYISQIRLVTNLEPGTHKCKAYVAGYSKDDFKCIGVQYMNLTVEVRGAS